MFDSKNILIFIVCSTIIVNEVISLSCVLNACSNVTCPEIPPCKPGFKLTGIGNCKCCKVCKEVKGEGGNCKPDKPIAGWVSETVVCDNGLYCDNGTCVKTPK